MPKEKSKIKTAYFSMEFGLHSEVPSYAGGLGMLAGDILRSCADLEVPALGISLVYSQGFVNQMIKADGSQDFTYSCWVKQKYLTDLDLMVTVPIEGRDVKIKIWEYKIVGMHGFCVPVYLLDTYFDENDDDAKNITCQLYTSNWETRLKQEIVLGIGGVRALRALGHKNIETYHMNEGHAALLTLELLKERDFKDEEVKKSCVFTTHTPIPAGHDHFSYDTAHRIAGDLLPWHIKKIAGEDSLSMSELAFNMSHDSNAVSKKHKDITEHIFPGKNVLAITNGVHHLTWTSMPFKKLYDKYIPEWGLKPGDLKKALTDIPDNAIWEAHMKNKKALIGFVNHYLVDLFAENFPIENEDLFEQDILTIAYARRSVPYKRPLLIYRDLKRLIEIGDGKLQIIHAGKCSPGDEFCLDSVDKIVDMSRDLRGRIKIAYLDNYDIELAQILTQGSDVWFNCPVRPLEASGTSGMKAALNGSVNLSILDGWFIEAMQMDPLCGFKFGAEPKELEPGDTDKEDSEDLYRILEEEVIPDFYERREKWLERMRHSMALGAYFNTHRCVKDYDEKMWK